MFFYYVYRFVVTVGALLGIAFYYLFVCIVYPFSKQKRAQLTAVWLRRSFEFLGATYIKLGQIMAMRPDYFSEEMCNELYKLFDKAKPDKYERILKILKERLGANYQLFSSIEQSPLGSASFAQVHRAVLKNGQTVAVKVQRPKVRKKVHVDLFFLNAVIGLVDLSTVFSYIKLKPFYSDFAKWTADELDYRIEAGNSLRLSRNIRKTTDRFKVPEIVWELSDEKVLTMEVFEGVWLSDVFSHRAALPDGFDADSVTSDLVQLFLHQIFVDGFFHADPHPGNIILLNDGRIGLIDFGIIGIMNSEFKRNMLELLQQISARDAEGAFNAVLKIIKPPRDIDIASLKKEYEDNLNVWYNGLDIPTLDFHEKTVTKLLMSNIASLQKNKITLPNVVVQFYRCIILLESVALSLDPQKTILSEIEYFFRDYEFNIIMEKISIRGRIKTIKNYVRFFLTLPEKLEALLTKTLTADLNVRPYVNNFFKGVLMVLNTVSYLLLGVGVVVAFMKIFNPGMQQIWNFNVGLVILYLFSAGLVLRLVKRHISIEFR